MSLCWTFVSMAITWEQLSFSRAGSFIKGYLNHAVFVSRSMVMLFSMRDSSSPSLLVISRLRTEHRVHVLHEVQRRGWPVHISSHSRKLNAVIREVL